MRLVVDTNILIAALLRDSATRRLLVHSPHELLVPEHAFEELEKHRPELARRMGVGGEEVAVLLRSLAQGLVVVAAPLIAPHMGEARRVMMGLDEDDAVFVAAAIAAGADGIWTEDKGLHRQARIRAFATRRLLEDEGKGNSR